MQTFPKLCFLWIWGFYKDKYCIQGALPHRLSPLHIDIQYTCLQKPDRTNEQVFYMEGMLCMPAWFVMIICKGPRAITVSKLFVPIIHQFQSTTKKQDKESNDFLTFPELVTASTAAQLVPYKFPWTSADSRNFLSLISFSIVWRCVKW